MALNFQQQNSAAAKKSVPRVALVANPTAPEGQSAVHVSPPGEFISQTAAQTMQRETLETRVVPPPLSQGQRLASSFQKLASANRVLNNEITAWHTSIRVLNEALANIKLGVSGWCKLSVGSGDQDDPHSYWSRELGWSQHEGKWQICLKRVWGNYEHPEEEREEVWPFENAPRWLQLDAGAKLPDMVDVLIQRTEEMTKRVAMRKTEAVAMITDLQAQLASQERM